MNEKNMDNLIKEFNDLAEKLTKLDPSAKEYEDTLKALKGIHELLMADEKVLNDRLDKNRHFDLEEEKVRAEMKETVEKAKSAKREVFWKLLQAGFTVVGALLCILLTGHLEDTKLMSQKCFSFANWFRPKMF